MELPLFFGEMGGTLQKKGSGPVWKNRTAPLARFGTFINFFQSVKGSDDAFEEDGEDEDSSSPFKIFIF